MTDDQLIAAFEAGTVAPSAFGHREHLRLAWLYVTRHGRAEAERRLISGLRALAARAGRADKFSTPLTLAWVSRIAEAAAAPELVHSFEDFLTAHPGLLERSAVREPAQTL